MLDPQSTSNKNIASSRKVTLATAAARQPLMNMYVGVCSIGGFAIELSRIPYAKYEPPANGITPKKKTRHNEILHDVHDGI